MVYMCPNCGKLFGRPRRYNQKNRDDLRCPFCMKKEPFIEVKDED